MTLMHVAQNDTAYKRWSYHSGYKRLYKLCQTLPQWGPVYRFFGPTTSHTQVWICDICHKQLHGRKQISIRCTIIEH